ncbi:ParM/StbA family protein [Lactococcus allomyrinae]|uniref:ParM/StbA family protein n=1 Tax=Lactococcus allomyrinae TaxID=2419773 RepID=A0A387BEU4_9LACT|nr:ParM/StbA family protein [Lactococcus allomyrinae]AYG00592.1 ParM/StbA family protein [Lactococcus allomyrinae]
MDTIFSIDLGNSLIKMKSDRGEYIYPASYLPMKYVGEVQLIMGENYIFQSLGENDDKECYIWGPKLENYHLPEKVINTYARSYRLEQKKVIRILEFALGRLAMDYNETDSEHIVVHLALGLSVTSINEIKTLSFLKKSLIGCHQFLINGKEIHLEIPSEEYILFFPQYMGSIYSISSDEDFKEIEMYGESKIGVVDIGGGTLLANSCVQTIPSPIEEERFSGIQLIVKEISHRINSTRNLIIEKMLRETKDSDNYLYSPSSNENDTKDITSIVEETINQYTRFVIAPFVTECFPDIEDIRSIVLTGGGANIISKESLRDEIGADYFKRLVFVENSELLNVRGLYKKARIIWEEVNVPLNQGDYEPKKKGLSNKPVISKEILRKKLVEEQKVLKEMQTNLSEEK